MKDKPYLDTTKPLPENQSPIDGSFPEQKPKKFETLELLIHSIAPEAKRINLYKEAFTHASFSNEHRDYPSYDRLEFLGDAVLDLVVGDLSFKAHRDYNSGKLSKLRSSIVEGRNLTEVSIKLGFAPFVLFSQGEKKNAQYHGHIFEDVFEAFIGALYLDLGYDYTYKFIAKTMNEYIHGVEEAGERDWKSDLLEEIQAEFKVPVVFEIVKETGSNTDKSFEAVAKVNGVILGTGIGHNKKQAETEAAKEALLTRQKGE